MQTIIPYQKNAPNKYRLIIDPPFATKNRITALQHELDGYSKGIVLPGGTSFIFLAEFDVPETEEQSIIDAINKIALGAMPFKQSLKKLSHLDSKEIYIELEEITSVLHMINRIRNELREIPETHFNTLPRITIARKLLSWQFDKLWSIYKNKSFHARFIVNELILLKQMAGFTAWQILDRPKLQNQLLYNK